jgi:predicted nuclease of predicted toxin-antitoxin system
VSSVKLVVDMNLSPRWVEYLTARGFVVIHWLTAGAPDAKDAEIIEFARTNDYVVLTNDLDFGAILAVTKGAKPSVVQIRANDVRPEAIGRQIVLALRQVESELVAGALVTILPERTRLRILPLLSRKRNTPDRKR